MVSYLYIAQCENCKKINYYKEMKKSPAGGLYLDCEECGYVSVNIPIQRVKV